MKHDQESHTEWLGSKETAELLGISLRTTYRLVDDGQLPAYQIGRVIRFKRDEVEAFIESTRIQPGDLRHLYDLKAQSGKEA